jgi:hypothetical protein
MLLSDAGAACSTIAVAFLLFTGQLEVWQIYCAVAVNSTFSAFRWPAYTAATTLLVPKQYLGRANGMLQLGHAASQLVAPVLAGVLVGTIQLHGVILLDFTSFLFAFVTLLLIRIPQPNTTTEGKVGDGSVLSEAFSGWTYISRRSGLLGLLIFYCVTNFSLGIVEVLLTPLVLSFASTAVLGTVLSIGGSGMLLGSVVMSVWRGLKHPTGSQSPTEGNPPAALSHRIYCVLGFTLLQGILLCVGGLRASTSLIAATAFVFLFSLPPILASSQAIWHSKVPPDIQGRVFALQRTIGLSSLPFAYLIAGPLADRVFEPMLAVNGPLANSVGRLIGVGPGRGIGLLFIVLGIFNVLVAIVGYLYPRLRLVEDELPDTIADFASATVENNR